MRNERDVIWKKLCEGYLWNRGEDGVFFDIGVIL